MQTSYALNQGVAFAGMKADGAFSQDIVTGENTGSAIGFGKFVSLLAGIAALPADAADITDIKKIGGVVISKMDMVTGTSVNAEYPQKSALPVMKKGRVWVQTESAVTVGTSDVHVRFVAGAGSVGAFRGATQAGETAVLPNAKWLTSTTGAGLALLEINL